MRRLVLSLFFFVFMGHSVFAEVSVKAYCKFTLVRAALYWTCPCNRNGEFWVDIEGDPENREEWNIEAPAYKWESASFTFNPDDQSIVYYALQPTDYGNPHTVTITVKWNMTHKLTGEKKTVTKTAQLQLDAVELGEITVTTENMAKGVLRDNRPGKLKLTVNGASADTQKTLSKKIMAKGDATPVEPNGKVNDVDKYEVSCNPRENTPLVWDTSTIYWYGVVIPLARIECCRHFLHGYEFKAELDANCVASKCFTVYMPDDSSKMTSNISEMDQKKSNNSKASDPVQVQINGTTKWKCVIQLADFEKKGDVFIDPKADHHCKEKVEIEENHHLGQWQGTVPLSEGGQGDSGTAEGLRLWLKLLNPNPNNANINLLMWDGDEPYMLASSSEMARQQAKSALNRALERERKVIKEIYVKDGPFMELTAKKKAGFKAAFKYHCTKEGRVATRIPLTYYPLEDNVQDFKPDRKK